MVVYAAGALLWRVENNELKVALVHRERYDDWSWAKGKVDPGEALPETAVREIHEETGLKVKLGVSLGIQRYRLENKNLKEVHYWAAKVTDKSLAKSKFKPNDEISQVVWLNVKEAKKRLSYSHDHEQLDQIVQLHESDLLDTAPLILLRHGKARSRSTWNGREATRPLLTDGNLQAEALPVLLKAFGTKNIYSSPWTRCLSTVAPYAQDEKVTVETQPEFTETANEKKPEATKKVLEEIIARNKAAVVCTHRPVLPTLIEQLESRTSSKLKAKLHLIALLKPGSFGVVHLSKNEDLSKRKVVDIEIHAPLITQSKK